MVTFLTILLVWDMLFTFAYRDTGNNPLTEHNVFFKKIGFYHFNPGALKPFQVGTNC